MPDSLFGSSGEEEVDFAPSEPPRASPADVDLVAHSECPPIPGLYIIRHAVSQDLQDQLVAVLSRDVWPGATDQVMVFTSEHNPKLPAYLQPLVGALPAALEPLPDHLKALVLHSDRPLQAIMNCYQPGQGISPHVDLPERYEDGIVGLSLLSSTVMEFRRNDPTSTGHLLDRSLEASGTPDPSAYAVRLRPGDLYVLTGDARWEWTHGIPYRYEDVVQDEQGQPTRTVRNLRMSVTLRRMKPGADCVGSDSR